MKRFVTVLILAALALALLAAGAASAGAARGWACAPHTVATFSPGDYGSFAEGMAADSHGNLWVSLTTWGLYDDTQDPPIMEPNTAQLLRVTPGGVAKAKATMELTAYGFLLGVAVRDDRIYVAVYDAGADVGVTGVYRLDRGGKLTQVVVLPEGAWPNGIAFHGRFLYIADSGMGVVWRAPVGAGKATVTEPWLQDDLLLPADPETGIGANGIAFRGGRLFVSVADFGRIVHVPVARDGSAGTPVVVTEDAALKTADGIAFDAFGGLWVTTDSGTTGASPGGGLYRLTPCAGIWTIADDPGWLNYPTTPVFGTTPRTACTLYIENGAFYGAYGDGTAPAIQALRVGIPGLPLW